MRAGASQFLPVDINAGAILCGPCALLSLPKGRHFILQSRQGVACIHGLLPGTGIIGQGHCPGRGVYGIKRPLLTNLAKFSSYRSQALRQILGQALGGDG